MAKKVGISLCELAPAAIASKDAGSRNLGPVFLTILVLVLSRVWRLGGLRWVRVPRHRPRRLHLRDPLRALA